MIAQHRRRGAWGECDLKILLENVKIRTTIVEYSTESILLQHLQIPRGSTSSHEAYQMKSLVVELLPQILQRRAPIFTEAPKGFTYI